MKEAVAGELAAAYHSALVDEVRAGELPPRQGPPHAPPRARVRLLLRRRSRRRLRLPGGRALPRPQRLPHRRDHPQPARQRSAARQRHPVPQRSRPSAAADLGPDDVVILPAFGITVQEMVDFSARGCTLVDTTCGSVLNVWKNVVRYAQDGFTAIIHGKVKHEETRATASQALKYPQRPLPRRARSRRSRGRLRLHPPRRRPRRRSSRASPTPCRRDSIPTSISCASAAPTRRRC